MPARNEREYERRRQRIIDGALQVFASKGFEAATNKDVAAAAGVGSPGLIYHYFKDKADLFRHVMEERTPILQVVAHGDEFMDLPPREALTRLATAMARMADNRAAVAIMRLLMGEATRRPAVAEMVNSLGPRRIFGLLTTYFEGQMTAGTLRRMDPGAAARCFAGPLMLYLLAREVFPQPDARTLTAETMATTAVDVFLCGMEVPATNMHAQTAPAPGTPHVGTTSGATAGGA
ncbi:MAG TPA: TetR/AcrR family transcriptional regulator [Ktedonobacterales bacterium]|jgi:AcrR family transcriptional regulator